MHLLGRLATLVLGVALVAAACSGDDDGTSDTTASPTTVPASDFADALCTALLPLPDQMAAVTDASDRPQGTEEARTAVLAQLEDLQATVVGVVELLDATGPPDVNGGAETADRYRRAFEKAQRQLQDVYDYIAAPEQATEEVLFESGAVIVVMQSAFQVLNGDPAPIPAELNDAFNASEPCQEFAAASGAPEATTTEGTDTTTGSTGPTAPTDTTTAG
ncbi:MAG: hypothetical protein IPM45_09230 [Acidimicrobiales bacterium]|nr:hypothetical protein [Acidimicrobiales bacterium]